MANNFVGSLSVEQRNRLRRITKAEHLRHYPGEFLTDRECDRFIETWHEEYAEQQLARRGFD